MLFNVPQFIDIEDKIVGPLTAKQLGWLVLGGITLLVLFNFLDMEAFYISAVVVGIVFGSLAFYKPYGQPLIKFLGSSVTFVLRPKIYTWRRLPDAIKIEHAKKRKEEAMRHTKKINEKEIEELVGELNIRKG